RAHTQFDPGAHSAPNFVFMYTISNLYSSNNGQSGAEIKIYKIVASYIIIKFKTGIAIKPCF
ncbi:hypothetical protein L9F63_008794, partial [Diploptera punctata]